MTPSEQIASLKDELAQSAAREVALREALQKIADTDLRNAESYSNFRKAAIDAMDVACIALTDISPAAKAVERDLETGRKLAEFFCSVTAIDDQTGCYPTMRVNQSAETLGLCNMDAPRGKYGLREPSNAVLSLLSRAHAKEGV